jgi:hypothetical protein
MPLPEQKSGTVANIEIKIKEKVAQNCWPILAQFNWPATLASRDFNEIRLPPNLIWLPESQLRLYVDAVTPHWLAVAIYQYDC